MTRPRKPTALLETMGSFTKNPQRRKHRQHEPKITGEVVKPKYLKGRAARIWDEIAPQLVKARILTSVAARSFATWCCLEAEWEEAPEHMNASRIAQKRAYGQAFGLDAASHAKLIVRHQETPASDPAEKYFDRQILQ